MLNCTYRTYDCISPFDEGEILRYAGVRGEPDEGVKALLKECLTACKNAFTYRVCYRVLTKEELFQWVCGAKESEGLRLALGESKEVLLFAATVGVEIDRLMERYGGVAPSKALFFQAVGAERIEELCDRFCKEFAEKNGGLGRRFSPGYADFPLTAQRDIFRLLQGAQTIGVHLTDGLTMLPTKSVTAVAGLGGRDTCKHACADCGKKDCGFRV